MRKALRQAQGERTREAPLRRGVGDVWGAETPRASHLWIPAFAGMTRVGECGKDERWGRPRAAPLPWVPARAGTTMGGVMGCVGARGWCQGGGPLSRAGGSRTAPTTGVGRTRAGVMRELLVVEGPSSALRTGFDRLRANGFGRGACGGVWGMRWGAETPRAAPLPWVPVFTGTTMGGVRAGKRWWWWRAPFVCPQDRLRQAQGERTRVACLRRGVGGVGGGAPLRFWILACAGSRVGGDGGTAR